MRQVARTRQHAVTYNGWTLFQTPWNGYGGKQYAKCLLDTNGKERFHAGYSDYCSHKELRLLIRELIRFVEEFEKEKQNERL